MNEYDLMKLMAPPMRKRADGEKAESWFDTDKLGRHAIYGGVGAGTGALVNYLLGNKSLMSYLVSGGLGAGAGLGIEAFVNRKGAVKPKTKGQTEAAQIIQQLESQGRQVSKKEKEQLYQALDSSVIDKFRNTGIGVSLGLIGDSLAFTPLEAWKNLLTVSKNNGVTPSPLTQYETKYGKGSTAQFNPKPTPPPKKGKKAPPPNNNPQPMSRLEQDKFNFIGANPNNKDVVAFKNAQAKLALTPKNAPNRAAVELEYNTANTKLRDVVAKKGIKLTPREKAKTAVKWGIMPLIGGAIGLWNDLSNNSEAGRTARKLRDEIE